MRKTFRLFVLIIMVLLLAKAFTLWGGHLGLEIHKAGLMVIIGTLPLLVLAFLVRTAHVFWQAYNLRTESVMHAAPQPEGQPS